jgi:hypothetical protein
VGTPWNKFLTSLNIEKFEFVPKSIYRRDHWILQIGGGLLMSTQQQDCSTDKPTATTVMDT